MTRHLLILHGEDLPRRSLADQLVAKGFAARQAACVDEAQALIEMSGDELVIADEHALNDGQTVIALAAARRLPVIVLAAASDACRWLSAGAAACVAKPFRFSDLVARIDALLKRAPAAPALRIGGLLFEPARREMVDERGHSHRLTEKEVAILAYLHKAGARAVPRSELLDAVWGYAGGASTHTVETHIYRLRRKLADAAGGTAPLTTEAGGYRLAVG